MLKKIENNNGVYSLEIEISGVDYNKAISNYIELIPDYLRGFYKDDSFPEGKPPIEVIEKKHGDEVYKYALKKLFPKAFKEALNEANIAASKIDKITIISLSKQKAVCLIDLSTSKSLDNDYANLLDIKAVSLNPEKALESAIESSNADYLQITPVIERDSKFWDDLKEYCESFIQSFSKDITPLLGQMKVVDNRKDGIWVDINDPNPLRQMYPLMESSLFVCGVFSAALHRFIPVVSSDDERNIDKYIFSIANQIPNSLKEADPKAYKSFKNRLCDYSDACRNGVVCGYSMFGFMDMHFNAISGWSVNHEVKCALLFCDTLRYIKEFGEPVTLEDIVKIKHYSVNNTKTDIDILGKAYQTAYSMSMLIHQIVKGSLNGAVRLERKAAGQCQYCGREFKKSLFGLKCPSCKIKKDY